jgi:uncharacterized protein (TIGR03790 family)
MLSRLPVTASRSAIAVLAIAWITPTPTYAGGGPENIALVVNSRSWASLTVANHYQQQRRIPSGNVIYVDWADGVEMTTIRAFRRKILIPVHETIRRRGLAAQIDQIVYSSDFPYAISFGTDFASRPKSRALRAIGSITGLTYLSDQVLAKESGYLGLANNFYAIWALQNAQSAAFSRQKVWRPGRNFDPQKIAQPGQYFLSMMLAATSGDGNSVAEVLSYLRRSALADGTTPGGTIYLVKNSDIRSKARHNRFPPVVEALKSLGVRAEVIEGKVPQRKPDVQGAVIGTANFSWRKSRSTIRPGAICEHFTSYGGRLRENNHQTSLTELLRYGAAGASGTVTEPMAIPAKFPDPTLHLHYARGATLSEAFYQSIVGPYQTLIVGDPLCRPWAKIPVVSVDDFDADKALRGSVQITPTAKVAGGHVDHFELFVDGLRYTRVEVGKNYLLDTTRLADGHHRLRVVAIEDSVIRSQGRTIIPFVVRNRDAECRLTASTKETVRWGDTLRLSASAPGAKSIAFYHNRRLIGQVNGTQGEVAVDPQQFGLGPVEIVAIGLGRGGLASHVLSNVLKLDVHAKRPLPTISSNKTGIQQPGIVLTRVGGQRQTLKSTLEANWLSQAGVKPNEPFQMTATFQTPRDEVYQFQYRTIGDLKILIDEKPLVEVRGETYDQHYAPVALAAGRHRLRVVGRAGAKTRTQIRYGGPGTRSIGSAQFMSAK